MSMVVGHAAAAAAALTSCNCEVLSFTVKSSKIALTLQDKKPNLYSVLSD